METSSENFCLDDIIKGENPIWHKYSLATLRLNVPMGPFYLNGLPLIPAWISNHPRAMLGLKLNHVSERGPMSHSNNIEYVSVMMLMNISSELF